MSPTFPNNNKLCATNVYLLHHSGKPGGSDGEHRYDLPLDLFQFNNNHYITSNEKSYFNTNG